MTSNTFTIKGNTFPELAHLRSLLKASEDRHSGEMLEDTNALERRLHALTEYLDILSEISETDDEALLDDYADNLPEYKRELYTLPSISIPEKRLLLLRDWILPEIARTQTEKDS